MGSAQGPSLLLLVLVLVLVLVLTRGDALEAPRQRCASNGCCFHPSTENPIYLDCDLKGKEITFTKQNLSLPKTVHTLVISNGRQVILNGESFIYQNHLKKIEIKDIDKLTLQRHDFDLRQESFESNVSLTINRINDLKIGRFFFEGWYIPTSTILISNVTKCSIASDAFTPDSVVERVVLEDIRSLQLHNRTFDGKVKEIVIQNVIVKICPSYTFQGQIINLSLLSTMIRTVSSHCIFTWHTMKRLSVKSSNLIIVQEYGFRASVENVVMAQSNISTLTHRGLAMNVGTFLLQKSKIMRLDRHGLDIYASSLLSIEDTIIEQMHNGSVHRLTSGHPIRLRGIRFGVKTANNGSLRFAPGATVNMSKVVLENTPCNCSLAQQLIFADGVTVNNWTQNDFNALQQVEFVSCQDQTQTLTLGEYRDKYCYSEDDPIDREKTVAEV